VAKEAVLFMAESRRRRPGDPVKYRIRHAVPGSSNSKGMRMLNEDAPESGISGAAGGAAGRRAGVLDDLDVLSTGTLGWIRHNIKLLDPSSADELPATLKVKSFLELAQLCRLWARFRPDDDGLDELTSFVRDIWQRSDFSRLVAADISSDRLFALVYGALAPAGVTTGFHRAALAKLVANGDLTAHGKLPYARLETRYYAELAGVGHGIESYPELYAASILAKLVTSGPISITVMDAYALTHTIWYLTDFGFRDPVLTYEDRERVLQVLGRLTRFCIQSNKWDLLGEFLLAQFCLGGNPDNCSSMVVGIARLRQIQLANGAIPGRSAEEQPAKSATMVDQFQKCYHPTLQAGLASLAIFSAHGTLRTGGGR